MILATRAVSIVLALLLSLFWSCSMVSHLIDHREWYHTPTMLSAVFVHIAAGILYGLYEIIASEKRETSNPL